MKIYWSGKTISFLASISGWSEMEIFNPRAQRKRPALTRQSIDILALYRAYSISFNSSNLGNFFGVVFSKNGIRRSSENGEESIYLVFPSSR